MGSRDRDFICGQRREITYPPVSGLVWSARSGLDSVRVADCQKSAIPHREEILTITIITVALSALLHGFSAAPLPKSYCRLTETMGGLILAFSLFTSLPNATDDDLGTY